jgi:hypothetical protein
MATSASIDPGPLTACSGGVAVFYPAALNVASWDLVPPYTKHVPNDRTCVTGGPPPLIGLRDAFKKFYVKQGSLGGGWTPEATGGDVEQIALTYSSAGLLRVGYLDTNHHFWVKEGSLGAGWRLESSVAKDIALSGDLIGLLDTSDTYYVKEGGLGAGWVQQHSGVRQIALTYLGYGRKRIGYVDYSNHFYVSGWDSYRDPYDWVLVSSVAKSVILLNHRVGLLDTSNNYYVKEGDIGAGWVQQASGVSQIALTDGPLRIGYTNSTKRFSVKEGTLGNAPWVVESNDAVDISMSNDLIGFRDSGNIFNVKQGALGAGWVPESSNALSIALAGG